MDTFQRVFLRAVLADSLYDVQAQIVAATVEWGSAEAAKQQWSRLFDREREIVEALRLTVTPSRED